MARIAGVDIPREKRLGTSLTYIYGIGSTAATNVCDGTGIDPSTRVRDLTDEEVIRLRNWIDANLKVEGDLRRDVSQDIKRKMEIGSYQGIRHRRGCRCTGSAPTPTPGPARVRRRPSPARRRSGSTSHARRPARRRPGIAVAAAPPHAGVRDPTTRRREHAHHTTPTRPDAPGSAATGRH